MILDFVRHGETHYNSLKRLQGRQDFPLNEKGLQQAKDLARSLSGQPIECIYASTLQRAAVTAQEIQQVLQVPLYLDERLMERDFGKLNNTLFEEIDLHGEQWDLIEKHFPHHEIETLEALRNRVQEFLKDIQAAGWHHVLVVSHGATHRMFRRLLQQDYDPSLAVLSNCQVERFELKS